MGGEKCYNTPMNALTIVHETVKRFAHAGGVCVDATAGRGYDAAFLCECVGESGKVYAFDIQREAIDSTKALLASRGFKATVIEDSHANMAQYVAEDSANVIMFNLGYLPKGDHRIFTRFDSTRQAIESGLKILKRGGLMSICVYYGGDSGYEERDALMPYLATLDDELYQVITLSFTNWKKDPPYPVFIIKN